MRESLSAEAVLIAERCPDGTLVPAGATGLAAGAMTELLGALSRIDGQPLGAIAANQDFDAAVAALTGAGELAFCVPLAVDGERVGVLCIHPGEGERPDDDVLRSLARHAALSLARARRSRSSSLLPQALALQEEFDRFALSTTCEEELSYEIAATFHHWPKDRAKLVDLISPLYEARVALFINETADMTTPESEQVVERLAEVFEKEKPYLLKHWGADED